MSENELRLFDILQESDNLEQAVLSAIKVFAAFLEQLGVDPALPAVCPPESA